MLIWVCAMHCEAKPVIDYYQLEKSPNKLPFDRYDGTDMSLFVSGIGDLKMRQAIHWICSQINNAQAIWINLGIAGHRDLNVGDMVSVSSVSYLADDGELGRQIELPQLATDALSRFPLISVAQQQTDYHPTALYDMEGFAFIDSLSSCQATGHGLILKVISDNSDNEPSRNKSWISDLIARHMEALDHSLLPALSHQKP